MKRAWFVCLTLSGLCGCSAGPASSTGSAGSAFSLEIHARDTPYGVRYEGPLAGPYPTFEKMVETTCKHLLAQPTPRNEPRPLGYCAGNFDSPENHAFFISQIAPMTGAPEGGGRVCALSRNLLDPDNTKEIVFLGGASEVPSTGTKPNWRPTHFLNQKTMRPHDRDVLVFALDGASTCTVYDYEHFSRVVSTLRDGRFVAIGEVRNDGEALQVSSSR